MVGLEGLGPVAGNSLLDRCGFKHSGAFLQFTLLKGHVDGNFGGYQGSTLSHVLIHSLGPGGIPQRGGLDSTSFMTLMFPPSCEPLGINCTATSCDGPRCSVTGTASAKEKLDSKHISLYWETNFVVLLLRYHNLPPLQFTLGGFPINSSMSIPQPDCINSTQRSPSRSTSKTLLGLSAGALENVIWPFTALKMEVIRVENLANYQGKADALPEYTVNVYSHTPDGLS